MRPTMAEGQRRSRIRHCVPGAHGRSWMCRVDTPLGGPTHGGGVIARHAYAIRRPMRTNSAPSEEIEFSHDSCVRMRAAFEPELVCENIECASAPLPPRIGGSQFR